METFFFLCRSSNLHTIIAVIIYVIKYLRFMEIVIKNYSIEAKILIFNLTRCSAYMLK